MTRQVSVSMTCPMDRQDQVCDEVYDAIRILADPDTVDIELHQLDHGRIKVTAVGSRP